MHWCVGGVLGCSLDFVAGLFLDIVRVCALPYICAVYVLLLQEISGVLSPGTCWLSSRDGKWMGIGEEQDTASCCSDS